MQSCLVFVSGNCRIDIWGHCRTVVCLLRCYVGNQQCFWISYVWVHFRLLFGSILAPSGPVEAHCGAWRAPTVEKGEKSILGGHIGGQVGAYWAPLALCWIILGVFFINVWPGTLMGGDLAPKLGYLGLENVCFLCNSRQNQHVGEIKRRSTFDYFWGGILEVFESPGGSFGVSWAAICSSCGG